jgi:osmotically-inducible protein OsmY
MESNLAPANTDLDLDLQERVSDAIQALDVMHGSRAQVAVTVSGGQVTLAGILQSPMAAAEVAHAAGEVAGDLPVINHLLDDASLSSQVAEALSTDPRTAAISPGYQVASNYGHLTLIGYFSGPAAQAMDAVARGMPGVRSVTVKAL